MTMIHITGRAAAEAALKAHAEGRLSAQGPTPMCKYRDDSGCPCAIGAAMTDEQVKQLESPGDDDDVNSTFIELINNVTTDDLDKLQELQRLHDTWAQAARTILNIDAEDPPTIVALWRADAEAAEQEFLEYARRLAQ